MFTSDMNRTKCVSAEVKLLVCYPYLSRQTSALCVALYPPPLTEITLASCIWAYSSNFFHTLRWGYFVMKPVQFSTIVLFVM
jgi:hypothetical protein